MKREDYFKPVKLFLFGGLFITTLFADGDPQLSIAGGTQLFDAQKGKEIYASSCQGCHMADGKGANGAGFYPSLAGNVRLMSAQATLEVVTHGLRGMPSFREYLTNEQIAEVVNYVRTNFGNHFKDTVTAADVPK
ncbi:MAG: cytochrome c [Campylobacteraceae bacterium]|jgi:mono/diheme cytochrome c family protein|nr:cytochrome c [Campylobacteraceae bacterium]